MRAVLFGALLAVLLGTGAAPAQSAAPADLPPAPAPAPGPGDVPAGGGAVPPLPQDARKYWPSQEASAFPFPFWARAEYLLWSIKDGPSTPPLITTGPARASRPAVPGAPGTVVLFDGSDYDYGHVSGGRWILGAWCDCDEAWGAELTGFVLPDHRRVFGSFSDGTGSPVLGLPFRDALSGTELVDFAAFPHRFAGGITVSYHSGLWGMEGNLLSNFSRGEVRLGDNPCPFGELRTDLLAGFRYADLHEGLNVAQGSVVLPRGATDFNGRPVPVGRILVLSDDFHTRNQFYGVQAGAQAEFVRGRFFLDVLGKLALGNSHEVVEVSGNTMVFHSVRMPGCGPFPVAVGCPASAEGGFLATSTNIGRFHRDRFAVLPELGVNVGYQVCPLLRVFAGYTFLYWSEVVRPGDQVDATVNLTRVPTSATFGPLRGPARPALPFKDTDFWAQGVNFGVEFRY
jgi:hypothetical protein